MTPEIPPLADSRILRPAQTALGLGLLSRIDLLRLKSIARLYARGLPPEVSWEDLLQEALTRIICGSRRRPGDLSSVTFVAGVLRSLRSEYWRRAVRGGDRPSAGREGLGSPAGTLPDPAPGPERTLSARQELIAIRQLFVDDPTALQIIEGLGAGLSAGQIRRAAGISGTDYDSARRRMRRSLLREGLTCRDR